MVCGSRSAGPWSRCSGCNACLSSARTSWTWWDPHAVWLPTVSRAQQFERALHRGLATYRVLPSHTQDGHTEWFLPTAHPTAIRLIRQMPIGADAKLPPSIVAFLDEPQDCALEQAGYSASAVVMLAQDALWVMEDLFLRVAACCELSVESDGDRHSIRLIRFRSRVNGALQTLRWAVLDIERYRWRANDQAGAFVHMMAYDGDDLVLSLTPMRQIRTWADGALVWQVLALLERLRAAASKASLQQSQARSCSTGGAVQIGDADSASAEWHVEVRDERTCQSDDVRRP